MTSTWTVALLLSLLIGQTGEPPTSSSTPSSTPTPTANSDPLPASGGRERISPEALGALQARTEAALARAQALEQQLAQLQQARQADQQRLAALEQQVAEERGRREEAERSPGQRRQALGTAASDLDGAVNALAGGSDEVGPSLAEAQALAAEASRAGQHGSQEEAVQADEAQRWLSVSQEALSRGDLFQARQAAAAASQAARRAGQLAGTAPPAATGSSGSSY